MSSPRFPLDPPGPTFEMGLGLDGVGPPLRHTRKIRLGGALRHRVAVPDGQSFRFLHISGFDRASPRKFWNVGKDLHVSLRVHLAQGHANERLGPGRDLSSAEGQFVRRAHAQDDLAPRDHLNRPIRSWNRRRAFDVHQIQICGHELRHSRRGATDPPPAYEGDPSGECFRRTHLMYLQNPRGIMATIVRATCPSKKAISSAPRPPSLRHRCFGRERAAV